MSDELVEVGDESAVFRLGKLARHILYCTDENREISSAYTQNEIDIVYEYLVDVGLIGQDYDLTGVGRRVVRQLRERPR